MACLASAMIPLLAENSDEKQAQNKLRNALEKFPVIYAEAWQSLFRKQLGFTTAQDADIALIERLLQAMHDSKVDFTNFFRNLWQVNIHASVSQILLRDEFIDRTLIDRWLADYLNRLQSESSNDSARKEAMNRVNPKYVLRNH